MAVSYRRSAPRASSQEHPYRRPSRRTAGVAPWVPSPLASAPASLNPLLRLCNRGLATQNPHEASFPKGSYDIPPGMLCYSPRLLNHFPTVLNHCYPVLLSCNHPGCIIPPACLDIPPGCLRIPSGVLKHSPTLGEFRNREGECRKDPGGMSQLPYFVMQAPSCGGQEGSFALQAGSCEAAEPSFVSLEGAVADSGRLLCVARTFLRAPHWLFRIASLEGEKPADPGGATRQRFADGRVASAGARRGSALALEPYEETASTSRCLRGS